MVVLHNENPLVTEALAQAATRHSASPVAMREQIGADVHSLDVTIDRLRAARFAKKPASRDAHQRPTRAL